MGVLESIHGNYIHQRRVRVLRDLLGEVLPRGTTVLDVGCGDGLLDRLISELRDDLQIVGADVLVREETHVPVTEFDGARLPFRDDSFDVVMFVDVLHHTEDPLVLLREASRVAARAIVLKDHTRNGFLAQATLRMMDRMGNERYDVSLPFNYWTHEQWMKAVRELHLTIEAWTTRLGLYPIPLDWVFGRGLHFVARLKVASQDR